MRLKIAKNITQQTYELIRESILRGELGADRRLTEAYFAAHFGISKSPIREALNRLEADGLIAIVPRRGAYVRDFSARDTEEIYELREILETWAVGHAELNADVIRRLDQTVDEAEASLARSDREKYVRFDATFHRILAQSNPNSRLRKLLESMHDQMLILRHRTFALSSHNSVKQHRAIVRALEAGDRDEAARLMGEHIRAVGQRLFEDMTKAQPSTQPSRVPVPSSDGATQSSPRRSRGLEKSPAHPRPHSLRER